MKRKYLVTLVVAAAATVAATVAVPQVGGTSRPDTPVRVTNTDADPVPVAGTIEAVLDEPVSVDLDEPIAVNATLSEPIGVEGTVALSSDDRTRLEAIEALLTAIGDELDDFAFDGDELKVTAPPAGGGTTPAIGNLAFNSPAGLPDDDDPIVSSIGAAYVTGVSMRADQDFQVSLHRDGALVRVFLGEANQPLNVEMTTPIEVDELRFSCSSACTGGYQISGYRPSP